MPSERIHGTRINLNACTADELRNIMQIADVRINDARTDRFIAEDYLYRRFGETVLREPEQPCEREYELGVLDD